MRRAIAVLLMLVTVFAFVIPVGASAAVSMEFVPRTPKGTIFYLDIHSEEAIGAAVFELRFDDEVVEYRSVSGINGASVQATENDGIIKIAYGHPSGGSGDLIRLTFNALTNAETEFTLHLSQAVDEDIDYLTDVPDYYLSADVGRQVALSSGTTASRTKTEKSSSEKASKASKSTKSGSSLNEDDDDEDGASDEEEPPVYVTAGEQSLTNRDSGRWFLIGACSAILVLIVIAAAVLIIKRYRKKPKSTDLQEDESEPQEAEADHETDRDNSDLE